MGRFRNLVGTRGITLASLTTIGVVGLFQVGAFRGRELPAPTLSEATRSAIRRELLSFYPMGVSVSPDNSLLLIKTRGVETFDLDIVDSKTAARVTHTSSHQTQLGLSWAPDSSSVAYLQGEAGSHRFHLHLLDVRKGSVSTFAEVDTATAVPPLRWSPQGRDLLMYRGAPLRGSLDVIEPYAEGGMVITSLGEIDHAGDFQWSRDGSKVALVRDVRSGAISIVNSRASREERRLVVHPGAQISSLAWSPTGDALLVVARAPHDEFSSLFLVNIGNGVTTRIFQPAYELSNVVWSNDGKLFGVEAVRGGRFEVVVGDVSVEGARRTLTPESHSYRIIDVATNGDSLHVRGGPLTNSPVVSSIGWNGERTLFPGQAVVTGPSPSVVNIPAADGKLIPTLLWRPTTNSGVPDEAVMFIHGGPHLQELPTLDGRIAASLKRNKIVVIPNYRGSSGYGASWERYEDVRQQARDIADVQGYVEETLQIAPHNITAVASSYGMRPTLYVLRDNPRAFGTVVLTSLVRPTDEVCPIVGFSGTIFGFHGQNDPMQDAQEAKDIFQRCTEKVRNKFWKILPEEGHHFHRTTSLEIVLSALLER